MMQEHFLADAVNKALRLYGLLSNYTKQTSRLLDEPLWFVEWSTVDYWLTNPANGSVSRFETTIRHGTETGSQIQLLDFRDNLSRLTYNSQKPAHRSSCYISELIWCNRQTKSRNRLTYLVVGLLSRFKFNK